MPIKKPSPATKKLPPVKKPDGRQKHDWAALKVEFFESQFFDVLPFLVAKELAKKGKKLSSHTAEKTKGWGEEKRKWLEERARKKLDAISSEWDTRIIPQLRAAKTVAIQRILELIGAIRFSSEKKLPPISLADLERAIRLIKTELGEPSSLTASRVENIEEPAFEAALEITAREKKELETFLAGRGKK